MQAIQQAHGILGLTPGDTGNAGQAAVPRMASPALGEYQRLLGEVIDAHDGAIRVANRDGGGLAVVITLPLVA